MAKETAVLGGGCFWCLEAVFAALRGVGQVTSGYCGGNVPNPSYEAVCDGSTGHAEVVRIEFDPSLIGFGDLLEVFFALHDPTTLNRQGNDVGTQYRSVVYCQSDTQREQVTQKIAELGFGGRFSAPIVTEVADAAIFYPAEDYHHGYYEGHQTQPYCAYVISPKLKKLREKFGGFLSPS